VVVAESTVALLLTTARTTPFALLLAGVLLTAFTASIVVALRRRVRTTCRCFGPNAQPLGRRHVVRNGLLLTVVLLAVLSLRSPMTASDPAPLILGAVAGLLGAAVLVLFDEIVELFAGPVTSAGPLKKESL
jgi:hypothetical protein